MARSSSARPAGLAASPLAPAQCVPTPVSYLARNAFGVHRVIRAEESEHPMAETSEFSAFVRAHSTALLRSAYLLTGDLASAEDLVQDTFLRLYPRWSRVVAADVPLAYVRRSVMNNFLNSRRRGRPRGAVRRAARARLRT